MRRTEQQIRDDLIAAEEIINRHLNQAIYRQLGFLRAQRELIVRHYSNMDEEDKARARRTCEWLETQDA